MEQCLKADVCVGFSLSLAARRWGYFWTGTFGVIGQLAVAEGVGLAALCADRHTTVSAGPSNVSVEFALGADNVARATALLDERTDAVRRWLQAELATLVPQGAQPGKLWLRAIVLIACVRGDLGLLDTLVEKVPGEFERPDAFGMTPVMWSCATGSEASLRWAIGKRLSLAGSNMYCWGCTELAAANGKVDLAILAAQNGSPQLGTAMREELVRLDLLGIPSIASAVASISKSWQRSLPTGVLSAAVAAEIAIPAAAVLAARALNPSDAARLGQLRRAGIVTTKPCLLHHRLKFPDIVAAEAARDRITRHIGTSVAKPAQEDSQKHWVLRATCKIVPTDEAIAHLCNVLWFIASECGGEYDGWGAEEL